MKKATMKNTTSLALLLTFALFGSRSALVTAAGTYAAPGQAPLVMAKQIILPEFKLDGVKLNDAIVALYKAGKHYDANHKGVNFLVMDATETKASPTISLDLKNVTVAEAAERLAQSAGIFVTAEDYAFVFRPKNDFGAVELVAGKRAQFGLGAGKCCTIVGKQLPNAIHLKLEILSTNTEGTVYIQSLGETTALAGKRCDVALGDTMVSMIPTLKAP
jgi:hypothetical protein